MQEMKSIIQMIVRFVLVLLIAMGFSIDIVYASNWLKVDENSEYITFVDADSVISQGWYGQCWVKIVFRSPQTEHGATSRVASARACYEIDKGQNRYRVLSFNIFSEKDSLLASFTKKYSEYEYIMPDSVMDKIMKKLFK